MATKMCFVVSEDSVFDEEIVTFTYVKGLAFSQKCKNVLSFHLSIRERFPDKKVLEVSTKSYNPLGVALSAFNLKLDGRPVESIFHSCKVFENGSNFDFVKDYLPLDSKKYVREHGVGSVIGYRFNGRIVGLEIPTLFYDYIYIKALLQNPDLASALVEYDIFTDIEFNEKKMTNCQARACSIFSYMLRTGTVDKYMESMESFKEIYKLV